MHRGQRAPNRVLSLEELELPHFATVLSRLDELVSRDRISYLHPGKRWEYPWALERAGLRPGSRVLDAGCGDSIFPVYLAEQEYRVTALDVAFAADLGAMHGVHIEYVRASLTDLPLADEAYDTAFCISVMEHLLEEEMPGALQELRRVLRPDGHLLLTTDYYDDAEAALWHEGPDRRFPVDWRIFDQARLHRLILDAPGFRVDGELDLSVDWDTVRRRMRAYHGYPYTAVGVALVREE